MRWRKAGLLAALCSVVFLTGCGAKTQKTIVVYYPCGQGGPFVEARQLWEKQHPNAPIAEEEDNVVVLIRKIERGDRPDVFLGLGDREIAYLKSKKLIDPETITAYAGSHLCVVTPRAKAGSIKKLDDLKSDRVKIIALPDPEFNSVGFHARELLKKRGIWDAIQKKIINVTKPSDAMMMVTVNKADACFAYEPCLAAVDTRTGKIRWKSKKTIMALSLKDVEGGAFPMLGAVVKGARNPEGGRDFLDFLKSDTVKKIYEKWAFDPTPSANP